MISSISSTDEKYDMSRLTPRISCSKPFNPHRNNSDDVTMANEYLLFIDPSIFNQLFDHGHKYVVLYVGMRLDIVLTVVDVDQHIIHLVGH